MATGAEHYAEGERLIALVHRKTNLMSADAERAGERIEMTNNGAQMALVILATAQAHFAAAQCRATLVAMEADDWEKINDQSA